MYSLLTGFLYWHYDCEINPHCCYIVFYWVIFSKRLCLIPPQFFRFFSSTTLFLLLTALWSKWAFVNFLNVTFCVSHRVLGNAVSLPRSFSHGYLSGLISNVTSSKQRFLTHCKSLSPPMNQKNWRFLEYAFLIVPQLFSVYSEAWGYESEWISKAYSSLKVVVTNIGVEKSKRTYLESKETYVLSGLCAFSDSFLSFTSEHWIIRDLTRHLATYTIYSIWSRNIKYAGKNTTFKLMRKIVHKESPTLPVLQDLVKIQWKKSCE